MVYSVQIQTWRSLVK